MKELSQLLMPLSPRVLGMGKPGARRPLVDGGWEVLHQLSWKATLGDFFPQPMDGTLDGLLSNHHDALLAKKLAPPAPIAVRIFRQPVWSLDSSLNPEITLVGPRRPRLGSASRLMGCALEPAGTYRPAHDGQPRKYGIHLLLPGLVHCAAEIHARCRDEDINVVLATTCHFVYCHLLMHAWIEDMCALLDFANGESCPPEKRRYCQARARFGSLLLMEEALCEQFALGQLPAFLMLPCGREEQQSRRMPKFSSRRLISAIGEWQRERAEVSTPIHIADPTRSVAFLRGLTDLLRELYGYGRGRRAENEADPWFAVASLFGLSNRRGIYDKHLDPASVVPAEMMASAGLAGSSDYPVIMFGHAARRTVMES
jgi:hypothetical protein